ncbi:MAG: mechanosensitive ion channel family protein [bacterium]|nr:mechanosensitive ion channel family protein [bacterium]
MTTDIGTDLDVGLIEKYLQTLPEKALNLGVRVLLAAVLFAVGLWITKLLRKIMKRSLEKAAVETGAVQFVDSCLKVVLWALLILFIGAWMGVDAASIMAMIGSLGLTIGLALQGSLSNFAGGVLIMTTKPFKVGDYIIEDNHKNEGFVHEISIFYTRLTTIENKTVVIPNGVLANSSLTNVSHMRELRLNMKIGISYQADIQKAKEIILQIFNEETEVKKKKEMLVFVDDFAESSVILGFRCWISAKEYWKTRWDILEKIKTRFDQEGIMIPYNQLDVHLIDNSSDK